LLNSMRKRFNKTLKIDWKIRPLLSVFSLWKQVAVYSDGYKVFLPVEKMLLTQCARNKQVIRHNLFSPFNDCHQKSMR
jgi:hypothetical protein